MLKYVVVFSAIATCIAFPAKAQDETVAPDTSNTTIEEDTSAGTEEKQAGDTLSPGTATEDTTESSWEFSGEFSDNEEQSVLYVRSNPAGAVVEVDDSTRGNTPVEITGLGSGKHVFKIMKPGHFLKKVTVTLKENVRDTLDFDLVKPVTINLTSEPTGAAVTIDGKDRGTTPVTHSKLKPGEHDITISADGYRSFEKKLEIAADDSLHVVLATVAADAAEKSEQAATPTKSEDRGLSRAVLNKIALGAFAAFCAMIVAIELVSSD